jgi:uncharacterized PurR-regulated membrane protein YhhQ (DUF165 family)
MNNLLVVLFIILVEGCLITWAVYKKDDTSNILRSLMTVNMVLTGLLSSAVFSLLGFWANIGSVLFSAVFFIQYIVIQKFGFDIAKANLYRVFVVIAATILITQPLGFLTGPFLASTISTSLVNILAVAPTTQTLSVLAFFISQTLFLHMVEKCKNKLEPHINFFVWFTLTNILSSAIFLPLNFYYQPLSIILNLFLTAITFKAIIGAIFTPFVLYMSKKNIL